MLSAQKIQQIADLEEGIPLWGTMPESPSARAGLQYGDIILQINEHRVKNITDYVEALNARTSPQVRVGFLRNGERLEAELLMNDELPSLSALSFEKAAQHIVENRMIPRIQDDDESAQDPWN